MRALSGETIKVERALVTRVSKAPLLVAEEVNTPINVILQDDKHGRIFCAVRQEWATRVNVGDRVSATMIVQKRGIEGDPTLVAKKINNAKVEYAG